jgi:hypothetical protein
MTATIMTKTPLIHKWCPLRFLLKNDITCMFFLTPVCCFKCSCFFYVIHVYLRILVFNQISISHDVNQKMLFQGQQLSWPKQKWQKDNCRPNTTQTINDWLTRTRLSDDVNSCDTAERWCELVWHGYNSTPNSQLGMFDLQFTWYLYILSCLAILVNTI